MQGIGLGHQHVHRAVLGNLRRFPGFLVGGQHAGLVHRFAGGALRERVAERQECGAAEVRIRGIQEAGRMDSGDVAQ